MRVVRRTYLLMLLVRVSDDCVNFVGCNDVIIVVFVVFDGLLSIFRTQSFTMLAVCLQTDLRLNNFSFLLVVFIEPKAADRRFVKVCNILP